eukprot:scaffold10077_cov160-Amphora_coffeaeformis.AAC.4
MTLITIISTFTAISPEGKVKLADCSVARATIGDVKEEIAQKTGIPRDRQSLWWHGYLLDRETQTVQDACVGVTKDEVIDPKVDTLVLFLTTPIEKRQTTTAATASRYRSPSFDHYKRMVETSNNNNTTANFCSVIASHFILSQFIIANEESGSEESLAWGMLTLARPRTKEGKGY